MTSELRIADSQSSSENRKKTIGLRVYIVKHLENMFFEIETSGSGIDPSHGGGMIDIRENQ